MEFAERRRKDILWSINQNPVSIEIQRKEKVRAGGAYDEQKSTIGPFTVRIFQSSSAQVEEDVQLAGAKETNEGWGLLADSEADIQAGVNVEDRFDASNHGSFVVVNVKPQVVEGKIIGYQVDLEKVM